MAYEFAMDISDGVQIKVVGVGGAGGNVINRLVNDSVDGAEYISVNTDRQAMNNSCATQKVLIGEKTTKFLGCGGNPEIGEKAAEESAELIQETLKGADMVFIAAGMGGGTGTGAAPVVARVAKQMGILTVAIVTKPFNYERAKRMNTAIQGIKKLEAVVDSLIVIPNQKLMDINNGKLKAREGYALADQVLVEGVHNISKIFKDVEFINLDFADLSSVMRDAGYAHLGVGKGQGEHMAIDAATQAISSSLLDTSTKGAKGIIINLRLCEDTDLGEVEQAIDLIAKDSDPDCNVIVGQMFDPDLQDEMHITVVATGFPPPGSEDAKRKKEKEEAEKQAAAQAARIAAEKEAAEKERRKQEDIEDQPWPNPWQTYGASAHTAEPPAVPTPVRAQTAEPAAPKKHDDILFPVPAEPKPTPPPPPIGPAARVSDRDLEPDQRDVLQTLRDKVARRQQHS
ncbi:MAG: cell division protein FtsZ [Oscillospiraceae bacterium]|jgi:cell division protein FtsZ|nr:cell division protein FtsZ [Oscillospiraceae bacterium]